MSVVCGEGLWKATSSCWAVADRPLPAFLISLMEHCIGEGRKRTWRKLQRLRGLSLPKGNRTEDSWIRKAMTEEAVMPVTKGMKDNLSPDVWQFADAYGGEFMILQHSSRHEAEGILAGSDAYTIDVMGSAPET